MKCSRCKKEKNICCDLDRKIVCAECIIRIAARKNNHPVDPRAIEIAKRHDKMMGKHTNESTKDSR
jgi:hypothetical protein